LRVAQNPTEQSLVLGFTALNPTYGAFTDIIDNHQPMIKTRPDAVPNRRLFVGWGRVYEGYLLVGKLVGERAPTKFNAFIRKISICVNLHLR
jgi:hypothetical protein